MKGFVLIDQESLKLQQTPRGLENLRLLCRHGGLEIMTQRLYKGAAVWMEPAQNKDDLEFFYLLSGTLTIHRPTDTLQAHAGDSFYFCGLEAEVTIDVEEDAELLYISTAPLFGESMDFQLELVHRIRQIDEKDHFTAQHSKNVMHYALALRKQLEQYCTASYGDMVLGSLFHDIGKCVIPDEILKKPGRVTPEEYEYIKRHAQASADILSTHYSASVCRIAQCHHERLDGSGYPNHLHGEEIPFESRILAVADSFDAMTAYRGYNRTKTFEDAALELRQMSAQYDSRITEALMRMVEQHQLPNAGALLTENMYG